MNFDLSQKSFSDLLAIESPLEVIDIYGITDTDAQSISHLIEGNTSQSLGEFLNQSQSVLAPLFGEDYRLLREKVAGKGRFEERNSLYRSFLAHFRKVPKVQKHTHMLDTVHPAFFWNEMVLYNQSLYQNLYELKPNSSFLTKVIDLLDQSRTWADITDIQFKIDFCHIFSSGQLKTEVSLQSVDAWKRMMSHVILMHYTDGVRELWMINNKIWRFGEITGVVMEPIQVVEICLEAIQQTLELIRTCQNDDMVVKLVPSIYRGHKACNPETALAFITSLVHRRDEHRVYKSLIQSIDVSGRESVINEKLNSAFIKSSDFEESLVKAVSAGLNVMIHAGDRGNTFAATGNGKFKRAGIKHDNLLELAEIDDFEMYIKEHLRFVEDSLALLERLRSQNEKVGLYLNHGMVLASDRSAIAKDPKRKNSKTRNDIIFAGLSIRSEENVNTLQDQLKLIKRNSIEIVTCPTVNSNTDTIRLFSKHPWQSWAKRDINVSLSIDDMRWYKNGVTATDELCKCALVSELSMEEIIEMFQ